MLDTKAKEFTNETGNSQWAASREQGHIYHYGIGVEPDYKKAWELYEMASEHGDASATREMGLMCLQGEGIKKNITEAYHILLEAAAGGDDIAMCLIGDFYAGEIADDFYDYTVAMAWYQKAADKGNANAMCSIGKMYFGGNGVDEDMDLAKEWLTKAVNAGNEEALAWLGAVYYSKYKKIAQQAFELLKRVAVDTNPAHEVAEDIIAHMYNDGEVSEEDLLADKAWYDRQERKYYLDRYKRAQKGKNDGEDIQSPQEKGYAKGLHDGEIRTLYRIATLMLCNDKTVDEIMDLVDLSEEEIRSIIN